jgi:hypothetical protein
VEWKDNAAAVENYRRAVEVDPSNPEAYLQLGRCLWKQAISTDELVTVEEYLRDAIALCESVPSDEEQSCAENESDVAVQQPDPTFSEASNLLARLLSQSPGRDAETKRFLAEVGYKYRFSSWITASSVVPEQARGSSSASKRLQNSNVCAFDNALAPDVLQYMQNSFASDSPFWPEHGYDSPTSGFFSYQLSLVPTTARSSSEHLTTFESVVHSIWDTAQKGMPKLKNARFAEWWCHSRPHCNGHKLHYDFVTDDGTKPRFPIASTVTFVTAG